MNGLMLFIWVIGWLIACGQHAKACEVVNKRRKLTHYAVLFLVWPHYLGYGEYK